MQTIFALSSGSPPAGIAVIRISGAQAGAALSALAGDVPPPRMVSLRQLHAPDGEILDQGLVVWFPAPGTVTGEDLAELHVHGGRAVVAAVERCLAALPGLRRAEPGEFTRRAFVNGRIDLAESEGLADLLEAETEMQRCAAMAMAGGAFSREVERWREQVLALSAQVEAVLDFSEDDDVGGLPPTFAAQLSLVRGDIQHWLDRPRATVLKEGFRVVLSGPPNAGKSTLFNALVDNEAAITAPTPGTTRDVLERTVAISGAAFTFVDTAGLHDGSDDAIERIGIDRARRALASADLILWLGPEGEGPAGSWEVEAKLDDPDRLAKSAPDVVLSARTGSGMERLRSMLLEQAMASLPKGGEAALSERQSALLTEAVTALNAIDPAGDLLLNGESLRQARLSFDRIIGRTTTEDMLDALFGRFCIGK